MEITSEKLKSILEAHELWVKSEGKEGIKADLRGVELDAAGLILASLSGVDLEGAVLVVQHHKSRKDA
ncbi:hypothetical protein UFOVP380_47 [uncultured Caudovirales phage]|uniref:Uncharacterized protein n=1 Tax=uncultured Caudovirales phage TaxID=2100421 RepID=A0A6J7WZZ8_9CAUD|nr:hypothetical protein UFOVP380_47 [uncultured Caudovirales phage]